jgi:hypothetical protein
MEGKMRSQNGFHGNPLENHIADMAWGNTQTAIDPTPLPSNKGNDVCFLSFSGVPGIMILNKENIYKKEE